MEVGVPLTNCLKGKKFMWNLEAQNSFKMLKKKLVEDLVLVLPYFTNFFQVDCDASRLTISPIFYVSNWYEFHGVKEFVVESEEVLKWEDQIPKKKREEI